MNSKSAFVGSTLALLLCAGLPAAQGQEARTVAADNTAVNVSDRNSEMATPTDQGNDADSIKVTADIRKAVVADKTLSTSAHNVKIVTSGNTVTLRGPVVSAEEKERVASLARHFAHGRDVLDQLTVKGV